jgi:uncharacterized ion transporter superfamily protein YfcC
MESKEKVIIPISDKTIIGMNIAQLFGILFFIFSVGGGFAIINSTAQAAHAMSCENTKDIQQLRKDAQKDRELMLDLIREVRESQIRIEGRLDLKQDKKFN